MDALLLVGGGLGGLAGGLLGGLRWGEALRDGSASRYWRANLAVALVSMALTYAGLVQGWMLLAAGGVGLMGGGVTGLKYGFARSIGVWRTADRLTGTDDLPRD